MIQITVEIDDLEETLEQDEDDARQVMLRSIMREYGEDQTIQFIQDILEKELNADRNGHVLNITKGLVTSLYDQPELMERSVREIQPDTEIGGVEATTDGGTDDEKPW